MMTEHLGYSTGARHARSLVAAHHEITDNHCTNRLGQSVSHQDGGVADEACIVVHATRQ
jgi:hypothetical protein